MRFLPIAKVQSKAGAKKAAALDSVQRGQPIVQDRPIGMQEFDNRPIVSQDFFEETVSFARHRPLEEIVEIGIQLLVGNRRLEVAEAEPLTGHVREGTRISDRREEE